MTDLPPKKEYVLYAPLTQQQRDLYDAVVSGGLRALLVKNQQKGGDKPEIKKIVEISGPRHMRSQKKGQKRKKYDLDSEDDDEYFARLEDGKSRVAKAKQENDEDAQELGRAWALKEACQYLSRRVVLSRV
jgi:ATP-dependent DNA helicase